MVRPWWDGGVVRCVGAEPAWLEKIVSKLFSEGERVNDSEFNLARIHEAIAAALPGRECLVFRERRFSWAQMTERSRRLGFVLREAGLGLRQERASLQNWQSGQDHVALYLYNGNEYLESLLGCFKARCASFNVNYRYVDDELLYLLRDSDARAVIFHASFAPTVARLRAKLPQVRLWLQVADDSGNALLDFALDYETALREATPREPTDLSADDLYLLYTGGTTGFPKGVLWRQADIFFAALSGLRKPACVRELVEAARTTEQRVLAAPPMMHGGGQWAALSAWCNGGTVVVQSNVTHFDAHDIWSTIEREQVHAVLIVGDAYARPLIDALRERHYSLSSLRLISSGGAILSQRAKDELLELLPEITLIDGLGSSETGAQATQVTRKGLPSVSAHFNIAAENLLLSSDRRRVLAAASPEAACGEAGWLAKSGPVPLGYLNDREKTEQTFPVIDGVRYAVPGDRASYGSDGKMILHGRDSITINSGGEKIFAEEVEAVLKHHEKVYDVVVVPTPSARWGSEVTALVQLAAQAPPLPASAAARTLETELCQLAREHLAHYKVPKRIFFIEKIERSPSGKADYRWAKTRAEALAERLA